MNIKTLCITGALLIAGTGVYAQKKKEVINDSNTPLHLLQPAYKVPYKALSTDEVKKDMDRVLHYLEGNTPTRVVSAKTGKAVTDYKNMPADAQLERGAFRLASYEWGVTYSAMLAAAEATGDAAYKKYVTDRFRFLSEVAPYFRAMLEKSGKADPQMRQILTPHALDDAGAVCAAMIKAQMQDASLDLKPLIENYMDFILNKEYRLADGTFARKRPQFNTLWLDDMFMGIPPVAWYSQLVEEDRAKYLSEAVRQVFQFAERMWVPEKKLFRHGWVEGMKALPSYPPRRSSSASTASMCAGWPPAKAGRGSGTSCSTATILTWRRRPRPSMYIAWRTASTRVGWMRWPTALWRSWAGTPCPRRSMRRDRWKGLAWVRAWRSTLRSIITVRSTCMPHTATAR